MERHETDDGTSGTARVLQAAASQAVRRMEAVVASAASRTGWAPERVLELAMSIGARRGHHPTRECDVVWAEHLIDMELAGGPRAIALLELVDWPGAPVLPGAPT